MLVPVPVSINDGTGVHHCVAAAGLAGQAIATVHHRDSVGAKCHSDHYHVSYPDNDHHSAGEHLPGAGPVSVRGGGDGAVSGVTMTTFTLIESSSA